MSNNYAALATNISPATTTLASSSSATQQQQQQQQQQKHNTVVGKYNSTESRELVVVGSKSRNNLSRCAPVEYHRSNNGDTNIQIFDASDSVNTTSCERYVRKGRPRTPPEPNPSSSSSDSYRSESFDPYRSRDSSTSSQSPEYDCRKHKHTRRSFKHLERSQKARVLSRPVSPGSPVRKRAHHSKSSSKSIKRKTPEKIPYYADQKREQERLRRRYGTVSPSPERRRIRTKSPRPMIKPSKPKKYGVPKTPPSPPPPSPPLSSTLIRSRRRERVIPISPTRDISPPARRLRLAEYQHLQRPRSPSPYIVRRRSKSRERQRSLSYEKIRTRDKHRSTHSRDNSHSAAPATQIITIPVPVPDYSYAYPPWSPQSPAWNSPMSGGASSRYASYHHPPYPIPPMVPPGVMSPLRGPPPPPPPYASGMMPLSRLGRLQRFGNSNYMPRMLRGSYNYRLRNAYAPN